MTGWICRGAALVVLLAWMVPIAGCGTSGPPTSQPPGSSSDAPAPDGPAELAWVPFTQADFTDHRRQGHTVLVDFTADW